MKDQGLLLGSSRLLLAIANKKLFLQSSKTFTFLADKYCVLTLYLTNDKQFGKPGAERYQSEGFNVFLFKEVLSGHSSHWYLARNFCLFDFSNYSLQCDSDIQNLGLQ